MQIGLSCKLLIGNGLLAWGDGWDLTRLPRDYF
jgi:hypothetical protein